MRYANRTIRAIERIGGREVLLEKMRKDSSWTNPERTVETWLERERISGEGMRFIWDIAHADSVDLMPSDFDVLTQNGKAA